VRCDSFDDFESRMSESISFPDGDDGVLWRKRGEKIPMITENVQEGAAEAQQVPAAGRLQRLAQIFDGTARPQPA